MATKVTWSCPCNGCKKAQKVIIDQIIEEYRSCPNIIESEDRIFCYTWWRHDNCETLRSLLNKITKDDKYTLPENPDGMPLTDEHTYEILRKLEEKGI
jgi:hypothetical protein